MSICETRPRLLLGWGTLLVVLSLSSCAGSSPRFTTRSTGSAGITPSGLYQLQGVASYYADEFHGRKTANGEVYDMHDLTAAHRTLPFNSRVRVTNLDNNLFVVVRINDRGPFKDDRVIDLSLEAAKKIALIPSGTARVELEIIELGPSLP